MKECFPAQKGELRRGKCSSHPDEDGARSALPTSSTNAAAKCLLSTGLLGQFSLAREPREWSNDYRRVKRWGGVSDERENVSDTL